MIYNDLSFIQPDLEVYYNKSDKEFSYKYTDDTFYFIIIMLSGTCRMSYKDKISILKSGDVFIANRKEELVFTVSKNSGTIQILFSSNLLHKYDKNYDLLKPFYNDKELKIFHDEVDSEEFKSGINNLINALQKRQSRAFVLTAFFQIICEINNIFESRQGEKIKETDSNYAKIVYYIDNHLFEHITLKKISEDLFLSIGCICNTIKRVYGQTYYDLIREKRYIVAREVIKTTNEPFYKVAERCGFETYSTFYRGYIKQFGISPKQEREAMYNQEK